MNETVRLDLHIHSCYSADSILKPRKILETAKRKNIGAVAITDHNTTKGSEAALKLKSSDVVVIKSSEIRTDFGDLTALFINEEIKSRDFFGVVDEINAQGGLIVLPHPFRSHRDAATMAEHADLIEIFNSRTAAGKNAMAKQLSKEAKLPGIGGSDAHIASEIGNCVNILPRTGSTEEMRKMLLSGRARVEGRYWTLPQKLLFRLAKFTAPLSRPG